MEVVSAIGLKIEVDDTTLKAMTKEVIREEYESKLKKEWLSLQELEHITGKKRKWLENYVLYDPYVIKNEIVKKDGDSKNAAWVIDAERIRPFLKRLFKELPNY